MVATGKYVPQSEFAKKHFGQGLEKGLEKGRLAEAKLVLKQLRIKFGDAVTTEVEQQVQSATHEQIERIGERLMTLDTLEAVLSDD